VKPWKEFKKPTHNVFDQDFGPSEKKLSSSNLFGSPPKKIEKGVVRSTSKHIEQSIISSG